MRNQTQQNRVLGLLALVMIITIGGCASFNVLERTPAGEVSAVGPGGPVNVVRGKPNRLIDSTGWLLGVPNRLAILDPRIDNHDVSADTEAVIKSYLEENGLSSVLVRVNQYDPIDEWKRLARNKEIRPFWRFTAGTYDTLKYTFLPGRLVGGDWYNPFTNTLNIYSDAPEIGVVEAAYALDLRTRRNPGAYATVKSIPFLGLHHETVATESALQYFETRYPENYEDVRQVLAPSYGAEWGGQIASLIPYGNVLGRIVGGTAGRLVDKFRR